MTQILITSASGANGDGYGAVLSFTARAAFPPNRVVTSDDEGGWARPGLGTRYMG